MWKTIALIALATVGFTASTQALAEHGWWENDSSDEYRPVSNRKAATRRTAYNDEYVYADVIDAQPIVRVVQVRRPQRECWEEEVYDDRHGRGNTAGATIAGGLIGGVIGRQIGGGKGRDAMTVVGTLIGSAIAHDNAARNRGHYDRPSSRVVERCETRHETFEEQRIEGYHVTYRYAGRRYATRTASDPGDRIRVRVAVTPARY